MDINHLKQLLELVREHELAEFEIEHDGLRVRIRKDAVPAPVIAHPAAGAAPAADGGAAAAPHATALAPPTAASVASAAAAAEEAAAEAEVDLAVVKSPIVGTFYRLLSPAVHRLSKSDRW